MAKYNTFVVEKTKSGQTVLVTSSARKAANLLTPGVRVVVWSENQKVDTIHTRTRDALRQYIEQEQAYIRAKQETAEKRNKRGWWRRAYPTH